MSLEVSCYILGRRSPQPRDKVTLQNIAFSKSLKSIFVLLRRLCDVFACKINRLCNEVKSCMKKLLGGGGCPDNPEICSDSLLRAS